MAVSLNLVLGVPVVEVLPAGNTPNSTTPTVTHDKLNQTLTLNANSTPSIAQVASGQKLMSAGAGTIDLTAVPSTNGATYNGNGQKVVAFEIQALATNAGNITVKFGASNPYNIFGASGQCTLVPGECIVNYKVSGGQAIGGTTKNIDLSGTTTDGISYIITMG